MKKFSSLILAIGLMILSAPSSAALISALPSDTYITSDGLDWTWASKWGTGSANAPELPTFHAGWRYATTSELDFLFENLVSLFLNAGNPIESTAYWNDASQVGVNSSDLSGGYIMSGPNIMSYGNGLNCTGITPCDTFYVRATTDDNNNRVPAPATLLLLALGLLALRFAKRKA